MERLLGSEFAAIDNRLLDLELKTGIKTLAEIDPLWYGEMAVKDAEHIKADVSKTEITELPEKWFVTYDESQLQAINDFRFTKGLSRLGSTRGCVLNNGKNISIYEAEKWKYEKISFSDFERLVLKKEQSKENIQEVDFEIDFGVPGQTVNIAYGNYSSLIVTSGNHEGYSFEGLCIKSTKDSQVGTFGKSWAKIETTLITKN